jgi:LacI family transcriptional regulator
MPTVTIKDIARAAQVNISTVSKALRGLPGKVAPETRQRIEQIARELGYRHNAVAATLRTRRSDLIGVIVPDLANPLFGPILQGLERALRAAGWMLLIVQTPPEAEERREMVMTLAARQIAGLVIMSAETEDPVLDAAEELGLPVVLVNRGLDERRFSSVVSDDVESMTLVVDHLHGLGHRRFAHLAGPQASSTGRARKEAFLARVAQLKGAQAVVVDTPAFTREAGFAATQQLLAPPSSKRRKPLPLPTAIVAGNDLMAVGALDALARAGLVVPRDVSVVGHNDMPLVDMVSPALTTVHIPVARMSQHAAQLLLDRLADAGLPAMQRVLMPQLVVRESTAAPAG